jgi:hypothetical protein
MPDSGLRVAVPGAGPAGHGSAALLAARGHTPVLWSLSADTLRRAAANDGVKAGGALDHTFVPTIATEPPANTLRVGQPGYAMRANAWAPERFHLERKRSRLWFASNSISLIRFAIPVRLILLQLHTSCIHGKIAHITGVL